MSGLRPSTRTPPFDAAWLQTVFLVPRPPARWPARFAVVTAHNPHGRLTGDADNARAGLALDAFLAASGVAAFEVTGASPGLEHREPGRGFEAGSIAEAAAVAARFDQQGFFWVEDGEVSIAVDGSGEVWPLGRWSGRLRTCP